MRAHAKGNCATVHPDPPQQDRGGQEEASDQPPAALIQRRKAQTPFWPWGLERKPEQLAQELFRIPVNRREHIETDDLKGD